MKKLDWMGNIETCSTKYKNEWSVVPLASEAMHSTNSGNTHNIPSLELTMFIA